MRELRPRGPAGAPVHSLVEAQRHQELAASRYRSTIAPQTADGSLNPAKMASAPTWRPLRGTPSIWTHSISRSNSQRTLVVPLREEAIKSSSGLNVVHGTHSTTL